MVRVIGFISVLTAVIFGSAGLLFAYTLYVTDDTEANLNKLNENNGNSKNLLIKNVGTGGDRHGFFKFDLSTLGNAVNGDRLDKATLRIYVHNVEDEGELAVHKVSSYWDEETFTSGANVTVDPVALDFVSIFKADENNFVTFDVTQVVRDWLDGIFNNYGLAIIPTGGGDGDVKITVSSKEKQDLTLPAELELTMKSTTRSQEHEGVQEPFSTVKRVVTPEIELNFGEVRTLKAECGAGETVVGGGYFSSSRSPLDVFRINRPDGNAWECEMQAGDPGITIFKCYALCFVH